MPSREHFGHENSVWRGTRNTPEQNLQETFRPTCSVRICNSRGQFGHEIVTSPTIGRCPPTPLGQRLHDKSDTLRFDFLGSKTWYRNEPAGRSQPPELALQRNVRPGPGFHFGSSRFRPPWNCWLWESRTSPLESRSCESLISLRAGPFPRLTTRVILTGNGDRRVLNSYVDS